MFSLVLASLLLLATLVLLLVGVSAAAFVPAVSGITAVAGLPACTCWLHYFCRSSYCVGGPVVAFVSAVAGGHVIIVAAA